MLTKLSRAFSLSLYTWGGNSASLGHSSSTPQQFTDIEAENIEQICFGMSHSIIVTKEGDAFTFGKGKYGALGQDNDQNLSQPTLLSQLQKLSIKVKQAAVGQNHSLLLTTEGDVWSMGYGGKLKGGWLRQMLSQSGGALGHGDQEDRYVPTPIQYLKDKQDIVQIAAGSFHSMALGESGTLYTWGKGEYGVLGTGSNSASPLPVQNQLFKEILQEEQVSIDKIQACSFYSAVRLEDGRVFMWGRNDDGQFGVGNSIGMDMYESEKWPVESNLKDKVIKDVKIGENITVFLTEDNKVYVSGNKLWWSPHELKLPENEEITGIFCGDRFGGFITDYRNVYHVGSMFGNKETEEIINLSLWKVKDEVFPEGKILEIGGSYRNHYCFLEN